MNELVIMFWMTLLGFGAFMLFLRGCYRFITKPEEGKARREP